MKSYTLILTVFLLSIANHANGQHKIYGSFNSSYSTINITVGYARQLVLNEFGIGLRRNISEVAHRDDLEHPIKRRLFRRKGQHIENWGLHSFYQRNMPNVFKNLNLFLFYDLQITHSSTRNMWHEPTDIFINDKRGYRRIVEIFGPYTWIEQNCGVGFSFQLSNKISLVQRAGIGSALVIGNSEMKDRYSLNFVYSDFAVLWSAGLAYSF